MNFAREGLNVLAGLVVGSLLFIIATLLGDVAVGLGSLSAAVATEIAQVAFVLGLAGGFFDDIGGKAIDGRGASDGNPLN